MTGVDGDTPLHGVARALPNVVLRVTQLGVELLGEVVAIIGVVLEAAGLDKADEIPTKLALAATGEGEWHHADGCPPKRCLQEAGQAGTDSGGVDDYPARLPDMAGQVDEMCVEFGVADTGPCAPIHHAIEGPAIGTSLQIDLDDGQGGAIAAAGAEAAEIATVFLLASDIQQ